MNIAVSDQLLLQEPSAGILVVRLNRPERYNALSQELVERLRHAVAGLPDAGARVMVLTAAEPGFCAGADLKERKLMAAEEKYAHNRAISALADAIAAAPIPTIAAINGLALGGGCELALACDMRIAVSTASIGLTEARIGAMPGAGGSQRLPRLIGPARALEMMYSGEPIDAAKAAAWGLVNAVVGAAFAGRARSRPCKSYRVALAADIGALEAGRLRWTRRHTCRGAGARAASNSQGTCLEGLR